MANPLPITPNTPAFISYQQVAITPSDTEVQKFTALYLGVAGDVTILPFNSATPVLFKSHAQGYFPNAGAKVMATGTTAQDIVALS